MRTKVSEKFENFKEFADSCIYSIYIIYIVTKFRGTVFIKDEAEKSNIQWPCTSGPQCIENRIDSVVGNHCVGAFIVESSNASKNL